MSNLTAREKGFMYVITLLIIVVLSYFFGIRTLNDKYDEYKQQLAALEERKAYLEQIKANNASMTTEIKALKEQCEKLELSFIDKVEAECVEQYVLKMFETEGCPYLISVTTSDVGMPAISYPDGSVSPDGLVCAQVEVSYSSTDGYTVTQFNREPDFTSKAKEPVETTIKDLMGKMGKEPYNERKGYEQFISALKKINAENPDCIKVDYISVADNNGILVLNATISFYGANLRNRLSVDNNKAGYTYWQGETNVDTKGGMIGFPYVCDNEDSLWYGVTNMQFDPNTNKPFAPYWANAAFRKAYSDSGNDIKKLIGFGAPKKTEEAPAT